MSKTLEELGYKKEEKDLSTIYTDFSRNEIRFNEAHNEIEFINYDSVYRFITMEELKAIYKYCIDNKWI